MSLAEPSGDSEASQADDATLSTDEAFELLTNRRRRYTIHYLNGEEGDTELGTLSRQVAAWENSTTPVKVTAAQRKRVYTSLQQFHLPKLDDKGIVAYDERASEVAITPAAEDLDVYLEVVEGRDIPWSEYYLGLAAVQTALLAAVGVNAWPFALLPDIAWGVFAVTTFAVSAAIHTYYNRSMMLGADDAPPSADET